MRLQQGSEPIACPKNRGSGLIWVFRFVVKRAKGTDKDIYSSGENIYTVYSLPDQHFESRADAFRDGCTANH